MRLIPGHFYLNTATNRVIVFDGYEEYYAVFSDIEDGYIYFINKLDNIIEY